MSHYKLNNILHWFGTRNVAEWRTIVFIIETTCYNKTSCPYKIHIFWKNYFQASVHWNMKLINNLYFYSLMMMLAWFLKSVTRIWCKPTEIALDIHVKQRFCLCHQILTSCYIIKFSSTHHKGFRWIMIERLQICFPTATQ
jgi:hypothetical protein